MKTQKLFCSGLFAVAGAFAYGSAMADNCSGHYSDVNVSAEVHDVGDGYVLVIFTGRSTATSDNSPYTGVGMCGGYALTTPDGKTRVRYACTRTDADGDSWSDYGGIEPGAARGTWTETGGTGKYAGNFNSGWFEQLVTDGTSTTGIWGGNCN